MAELAKDPTEFTAVEQVCWLASSSENRGRVNLRAERSDRSARKIQEALDAGAIDAEGWLTAIGQEIVDNLYDTGEQS